MQGHRLPLAALTRAFPPPWNARLRTSWSGSSGAWPPIAAVGVSLATAVLVLAGEGTTGEVLGRAALQVAVVGTPVATGLYAIRHGQTELFGRLLIAAGFVWSLAALGNAHE